MAQDRLFCLFDAVETDDEVITCIVCREAGCTHEFKVRDEVHGQTHILGLHEKCAAASFRHVTRERDDLGEAGKDKPKVEARRWPTAMRTSIVPAFGKVLGTA
jgi:hypothetical protein